MVAMEGARVVTAAVGGHVLGRMGKGKAALQFGLRLTGAGKDFREMLAGPQSSALKHQGGLMALHLYEGMADHLSDAIEHRVAQRREPA
jgi:hypothetical protein